jgi:hypothetical protein
MKEERDLPKDGKYFIENRSVSRKAFQELLRSLKGKEAYWCEEGQKLGEHGEGWDSADKDGQRYKVSFLESHGTTTGAISLSPDRK